TDQFMHFLLTGYQTMPKSESLTLFSFISLHFEYCFIRSTVPMFPRLTQKTPWLHTKLQRTLKKKDTKVTNTDLKQVTPCFVGGYGPV
ncbi:MAG TPA: hypothetical protein VGO47_07995, partial [Chlamydiales bacterium]|nr:hypothetical protein [Chlamydiales bacterium]